MNQLLQLLLTLPENELWDLLTSNSLLVRSAQLGVAERTDNYLFFQRCLNNRRRVLAVVHTDVNGGDKDLRAVYHESRVVARSLDDRLGLYMLLQLAAYHDFDLLVTTDEELGASTATQFREDHPEYRCNWMFSIDRRARFTPQFEPSVVLYEYHDAETVALCEAAGFEVEHGSFSDITMLSDLCVKGFNFSAAYFNEHTDQCWADMENVDVMLQKIDAFLAEHSATHLPHTPRFSYYPLKTAVRPQQDFATLYLYDPRTLPDYNEEDSTTLLASQTQLPVVERRLDSHEINAAICSICSQETPLFRMCPLDAYVSVCDNCLTYAMQSGALDTYVDGQTTQASGDVVVDNADMRVLEARSDHYVEYYADPSSDKLYAHRRRSVEPFTYRVWQYADNGRPAFYANIVVANAQAAVPHEVSTTYSNAVLTGFTTAYTFAHALHAELAPYYQVLMRNSSSSSDHTFLLSLADATSLTPAWLYMQEIFDKTTANDMFNYSSDTRVAPVAFFGSATHLTMLFVRQIGHNYVVDVLKDNQRTTLRPHNALHVYPHFKRSFLLASKYLREGVCFTT